MRRPLCGAALILFLICLFLPPSLWMRPYIREGAYVFTGSIGKREEKDGMQVYYLKDTSISEARWILVYLKDSNRQYFIGNTLKVYGTITTYKKPGNPGQFDSLVYYQTRKIDGMCFAQAIEVVDSNVDWFRERLVCLRTNLGKGLGKYLSGADAGIMKAMLLGERQELIETQKVLYQTVGISHVLSISGLHVSILGIGIYRIFRRTGLNYLAAGIPVLVLMSSYGVMIGAGASTLRALTMFFLAVVADFLGRSYDLRTALACSAIWILLSQPLYARDSGFLLSFGALIGIAEFAPLWKKTKGEAGKKWIYKIRGNIGTCLSVQMVTLPIVMNSFYEIPLYSVPINLLVIPWMPVLLILGILCALSGSADRWILLPEVCMEMLSGIAQMAAWGCSGILQVITRLAEMTSRLPGATIVTGSRAVWQLVIYYVLLGSTWGYRVFFFDKEEDTSGKKHKRRMAAIYGAALLILFIKPEPAFTMTVLDVGQGDGIFFGTRGGSSFLVDGGSTDEEKIGRYRLVPFLKWSGVSRLDFALISHGDEDHVSGIREILEQDLIKVKCLVLPISEREDKTCLGLEKLAISRGTQVVWIKSGDLLRDGKLTLRCLNPEEGVHYESRNAGSMVLSLEYDRLRILLTGDLEGSGEEDIRMEKPYDILKVAHHGSAYGSGMNFLRVVRPKVGLISCGADNSYGHPHAELLKRLDGIGCLVYQTPIHGAIKVESNGRTYKIQPHF